MVNEIDVLNKRTKNKITIGDDFPYVLGTVDWGIPDVSVGTFSTPYQIGLSVLGTTVRSREIIITGHVIADVSKTSMIGLTWEEYFKKQEEQINNYKDIINKMFSVYDEMEVSAKGYTITGRPETPVKYSYDLYENNEVLCLFEISLLCSDPMFYRDVNIVELSSMVNMFHFPLIIPENEGVVFGEVFPRVAALVKNDGDVPVGCEVVMTAHGGSVKDPKLIDVNTNTFIGFSGVTLSDGDYIIINTTKTNENAKKYTSSGSVSLIGNMIEGSRFLQISKGSEYYFYDMDGSEQNLTTVIRYREGFFNFPEM